MGWNDRVGDISYSVSGNFTYNKNKVTKYKGELVREWRTDANGNKVWYQNVGTVANGSSNLIVEGHEMNEYYMMNPYKGNGSYFNSDGTVNINGGPKDGMIRTEADMNGCRRCLMLVISFTQTKRSAKIRFGMGI